MKVRAAQLIQSWKDDSAEHALIWAEEWTPLSRGLQRECETCGQLVSIWPRVAEIVAANPLCHVVCRSKCMPICILITGPVPFGGRIVNNVLPGRLKDWVERKP
jgi:hypothetical protein